MAAVAGVEVDVAPDRQSAANLWRSAPLVVVADEAEVHPIGSDRRSDVLLVSWDLDDADVWRRAHLLGADHVVMLPDGRSWLVDRLADAAEAAVSGITVVVTGARGGAGVSVVASALAVRSAATGLRTVLIDADADAAGIDLVLGAEDVEGVRWSDLSFLEGRISGENLVEALPRRHDLRFLSCSRDQTSSVSAASLDAVLLSLRRGQDLIIVDLPRHDPELAVTALQHADLLLVVTPAEVRAVASATRFLSRTASHSASVLAVVRTPGGGELSPESVADAMGARLIGVVKDDARSAEALDRGDGPDLGARGPWRSMCDSVLDVVAASLPLAS